MRLLTNPWNNLTSLETLARDVAYGARLLRRNPIFAVTAILSVAIGIGASTTIFTVANGVLLRAPAAVDRPDALVDISRTRDGNSFTDPTNPYYAYEFVRRTSTTLADVYAYQFDATAISIKDNGMAGAERAFAAIVSTNYFTALGVPAAAGRLFGAHDNDAPGAAPFAVLSHRYWRRRFNADPSIVGQTVALNGHAFTVVGVARAGFLGTGLVSPDVWVPAAMTADIQPGTEPTWVKIMIGGRLKPESSMAQAAAEIDGIGRAFAREDPVRNRGLGLRLMSASPIPGNLRGAAAAFLGLLMALVSIVLVIACANLAGVLLARATARRVEIAVRLAMGAGRARLIRQLLTETLLLFALSGVAGVWLARELTALVLSWLSAFPLPVDVSLPIDMRVAAFTVGLSLVAAVFSGLAPALQASKADVVSSLKDDQQGLSDRGRLRSAFVIAQIAFSILLVVAAGLLTRALTRATALDQGFDIHGVELASLDLSMAGYTSETGAAFARELLDRVRQVPGVQSAVLVDSPPDRSLRTAMMIDQGMEVPGVQPPHGQRYLSFSWINSEPGLFNLLGLPLVAGRDFAVTDTASSRRVVIVSAKTAQRLWPGQDPIGKSMQWHAGLGVVRTLEVIGVARDLVSNVPRPDDMPLTIYAPLQQQFTPRITIMARTTRGQRAAREIADLVAALNPNLVILQAQTYEQRMMGPVQTQLRVSASVSAVLGIVGVLLASIGIYGVTAYAVTRRTREIGIRIAMGAAQGDVVRMVLRQGLSLVGIGSVVGLFLAAIVGRVISRQLFGAPSFDPFSFIGAAVLFAAVGAIACYVPARRAASIDAMSALRYE
jgi:predicted permease